jgi:type I restriction enzyme S subunit
VIESQTTRLTSSVAQATREISLLREYRTRLIADVVTGKLDVREAAASLPEGGVREDERSDEQRLVEADLTDAAGLGAEAEEIEA